MPPFGPVATLLFIIATFVLSRAACCPQRLTWQAHPISHQPIDAALAVPGGGEAASIIDRSPQRVAGGGAIRMLWIGPAAQADSRHLSGRGRSGAA